MNIKELFLSDLDLSDVDGWSDDYIAKINYNFTVIKNGRKKGPQGLQGPVGLDGSQGGQGLEGATGPTGAAGNQGPDGSLVWKRNINEYDTNDTIIPLSNVSQPNSIFPTASIILGRVISPTTPGIIDINGVIYAPEDNINYTYISQSNSEPEGSDNPDVGIEVPTLKINTTNNTDDDIRKHIRLVNYDDTNEFGEIYFDYNDTSTTIKSTSSLNLISNHIDISLDGNNGMSIGNNSIIVEFSNTFFNSNVELDSNSSLTFNSSVAQENNVIKSTDDDGTSAWSNISNTELSNAGGAVPIGSIIKIPLATFTSNFITTYPENNGLDTINNLVESELGKGINNYSGWYLCNGVTWEVYGRERIVSEYIFGVGYWANNTSTPVFENIPDLTGEFTHNGVTIGNGNNHNKILGCGNIRISGYSNLELIDTDAEQELGYNKVVQLGDLSSMVQNLDEDDPHLENSNMYIIKRDYVHIVYLSNPGLYQFLG